MKTSTPKVKLTGSKKDGYTLTVYNPKDNFQSLKWQEALVESELKLIAEAILRKIK